MKSIKSIYYHNPTPQQLERTICWLQSKGYRFISCDELYNDVRQSAWRDEKLVFLSLDDAWRTNLQLIPVIEKYHVPITIFAPVEPLLSGNYWWDYLSRPEREAFKQLSYDDFSRKMQQLRARSRLPRTCMTKDELRQLAQHPLVSIQSHTMTHPILTSLPDVLLQEEIEHAKAALEKIIEQPVDYFSYPNGSYGKREVEMVRGVYKMAFTTELRHITPKEDIMALPRIEVTGNYVRDKLKFYKIWPLIRRIACIVLRRK